MTWQLVIENVDYNDLTDCELEEINGQKFQIFTNGYYFVRLCEKD